MRTGMRYYTENAQNTIAENSQRSIKETNARQIFRAVCKYPGISRAELSKLISLSPSTVSVLTEELIRSNLLLQSDSEGTGASGRKPLCLTVNKDGLQIPSFSFRGKGLLFILYDLELNPVEEHFQPYDEKMLRASDIYECTERLNIPSDSIAALFKGLLSRAKELDWRKVPAITISFPGSIEDHRYSSSPLGWRFSDRFIDMIRQSCADIPVFVGDDTLFCAMAERYVNGRNDTSAIYVYTGSGVGAATVIDGQFFIKGVTPPSEIGHISVDYRGKKCSCGNRGCLERYISTGEILGAVKERILAGEESVVTALCNYDPDQITMAVLREALEQGDRLVTEILEDISLRLLTAISNMYCAFGSMKTYIGGDLTELGEGFLAMLRSSSEKTGYGFYYRMPEITFAKTPKNGECLGSAAEFLTDYFILTKWEREKQSIDGKGRFEKQDPGDT